MRVTLNNRYEFVSELRGGPELTSPLLHRESVTQDVADLIEEAHIQGVLAGHLPVETHPLQVDVRPLFRAEPIVEKLEVRLTAGINGEERSYSRQFATGRWSRSSQNVALQLREEGTLAEGATAYRFLLALPRREPPELRIPPLQAPPIVAQSLDDFGVRSLDEGTLVPDRPVLVNRRVVADCVRRCEEAGTTETGGAGLGKIISLPQPLPGTQTRIVTILSAIIEDPRHIGAPLSFTFSPAGLAEAARIGDLRGAGETVLTVYHTHGWSTSCGNCNQNSACPLAECTPSLQDYVLLESLFSSKSTLMPIAGRKLGEPGRRPVLQIYAWRGGEMRPIRFQQYRD